MKKIFSLLTVLFLTGGLLFADTGFKNRQRKIKCIQTEYFDIIFPESSSETAAHIAVNADSIYREVCSTQNIAVALKIPVVITNATTEFYSAHESNPHTKIIIVDSIPEELSSYNEDAALNAFRNKVTQAVNANYKSNFMYALDKLTMDSINFTLLTETSLMSDGPAAVFDGTIEDPYYLHHYRQAALENKFPSFSDVQGYRDIYPYGSERFFFSGPFAEFVQKKIGMEKYAEFIYNCINNSISTSAAFKKACGIALSDVWQEFSDSIEKPSVKQQPLEEQFVTDFFTQTDELSVQNRHGGLYNSFASAQDFTGYYDIKAGKYFLSKRSKDGTFSKPSVLFSKTDVANVKFSSDGNLYAVTAVSAKNVNRTYELSLHSMNGGRTITLKENNLRDGTIIQSDGNWYLAAVKLQGQYNSIAVYKINLDEKQKLTSVNFVNEIELPRSDAVFSLTDAGNGKLACIYQKGILQSKESSWSIRLFTEYTNPSAQAECKEINIPVEGIRIKLLTSTPGGGGDLSSVKLAFSWAQKNTFPRIGFITLNDQTAEISLMDTDVSGGIYNIACFEKENSRLPYAVYNSYLYNRNNIYMADTSLIPFAEYTTEIQTVTGYTKTYFPVDSLEKKILAMAADYKSGILKQSFILPVGLVSFQDSDFNSSFLLAPFGVTWKYYDLWGSQVITTAAAFNPFLMEGGISIGIEQSPSACGTDKFSFSETSNIYFSHENFSTVNNFQSKLQLPAGNISKIIIEEKNDLFYGHELHKLKFELGGKWIYFEEPQPENFISDANTLGLFYSTKRSAGTGYFEHKGISFGANWNVSYKQKTPFSFSLDYLYQQISPVVSVSIPKLIPLTCPQDFSYNLPSQIDISLYPDKDTFLKANAEIIFFAKDFQFTPDYFIFFTRRFICYGDIYANIKNQNGSMEITNFADNIKNIGSMTFSPGVKLTLLFNIRTIEPVDSMGINKFGISAIYEPKESKYPKASFTMDMVF